MHAFTDVLHAQGPAAPRPLHAQGPVGHGPAAAQHTPPPPPPLQLPAVPRLVAIGDLHGDLAKARRAFRLAGLIDERDRWAGGTTTVVQVCCWLAVWVPAERGGGRRGVGVQLIKAPPFMPP